MSGITDELYEKEKCADVAPVIGCGVGCASTLALCALFAKELITGAFAIYAVLFCPPTI